MRTHATCLAKAEPAVVLVGLVTLRNATSSLKVEF